MEGEKLIKRLEALGHWFFYVTISLFGHRGAIGLLGVVVTVYTLFSRKIHNRMRPYLVRRFPGESFLHYRVHGFKLLFNFGKILVERGWLGIDKGAHLQGDFEGYDRLLELIDEKRGVVLITAHVGNWQSALSHLENLPVPVNALMRYDQQAAAKHYFDLGEKERPFSIIDVDGEFGGMIEALAALKRGELVTIMADRYVKGSFSAAAFLGDEVRFPDSAYLLAASNNAPVVIVFAAKTGLNKYKLEMWDNFYPRYGTRQERKQMLQDGALNFAASLQSYLRSYPYQWYNFYNFWKQ